MKLWELKAQALRIMFTDTDIEFSEEEFREGTVYENANTREKLIRMEDSIKRAIDLFYQYNGEVTRMTEIKLFKDGEEYKNFVSGDEIDNLGYPTRIDINPNLEKGIWGKENIPFTFDRVTKNIFFTDFNFANFKEDISFTVYYKLEKANLPDNVRAIEMEFDLDELGIPPEVQRQIPLYVKSELFEEDELQLSMRARSEYIEFLMLNRRKNYSKVNTKVKSKFPRGF